jgi:hypothetical protein
MAQQSQNKPSWTQWLLAIAATLAVALTGCYLVQPDALAALVLIPPWVWLVPAGLALLLGIRQWRSALFRVTLVVWGLFTFLFVEQIWTLSRSSEWPTQEWTELCQQHDCLRVVSLNCGDGGVKSLREVDEWNPDLVLIQESPGDEDVRQAARKLFGENAFVVYDGETTIIGRGELETQISEEAGQFVHARVILPQDQTIQVVSLHLSPPVFRTDFWTPGFWSDHYQRRREHRTEIEELLSHLEQHVDDSPLIVGGDFNAPPYDDALLRMNHDFQDTFLMAGRGWGGTGSNESGMFRVDQIWVNDEFRIGAAFTVKTVHSDHRMVVCDLLLDATQRD